MPSPNGPPSDRQPGAGRWLLAAAGVLLPVAGVLIALYGVFDAGRRPQGWYWIGAGVALIIADLLFDRMWARRGAAMSDEPDLNRRGSALIGQVVTVVEPIAADGRGSVRAADSVWAAEGAEAAAGTRVKVAGVKGTVLIVERA
jgi:membrane protein implicated in regulation of membrane protease activity